MFCLIYIDDTNTQYSALTSVIDRGKESDKRCISKRNIYCQFVNKNYVISISKFVNLVCQQYLIQLDGNITDISI